MRLPLIDGQGNFGSMDGDPPAAMRYTEARLAKAARQPARRHRQGHRRFPAELRRVASASRTVLPARFPNLLVNGAGGIAVGMATNIPPHNLGEVIDACCALYRRPDITIEELMEHRAGPGLPDRRLIMGRAGIRQRLSHRPRLRHHARARPRWRRSARTARPSSSPRSLSGEQGPHDGADRRTGARQEDRGHLRPARRVRPRRHARRDRAEARRRSPTWC